MQPLGRSLALIAPLVLALLVPGAVAPLSAQEAGLPTSEAEEFLGQWALPIDSGQGMINLNLDIVDSGGQVAAEMTSDMDGASETASRVSRSGSSLVLEYMVNAQGQQMPVQITLTPSGDDLAAAVDAADGMFLVEGTATRR